MRATHRPAYGRRRLDACPVAPVNGRRVRVEPPRIAVGRRHRDRVALRRTLVGTRGHAGRHVGHVHRQLARAHVARRIGDRHKHRVGAVIRIRLSQLERPVAGQSQACGAGAVVDRPRPRRPARIAERPRPGKRAAFVDRDPRPHLHHRRRRVDGHFERRRCVRLGLARLRLPRRNRAHAVGKVVRTVSRDHRLRPAGRRAADRRPVRVECHRGPESRPPDRELQRHVRAAVVQPGDVVAVRHARVTDSQQVRHPGRSAQELDRGGRAVVAQVRVTLRRIRRHFHQQRVVRLHHRQRPVGRHRQTLAWPQARDDLRRPQRIQAAVRAVAVEGNHEVRCLRRGTPVLDLGSNGQLIAQFRLRRFVADVLGVQPQVGLRDRLGRDRYGPPEPTSTHLDVDVDRAHEPGRLPRHGDLPCTAFPRHSAAGDRGRRNDQAARVRIAVVEGHRLVTRRQPAVVTDGRGQSHVRAGRGLRVRTAQVHGPQIGDGGVEEEVDGGPVVVLQVLEHLALRVHLHEHRMSARRQPGRVQVHLAGVDQTAGRRWPADARAADLDHRCRRVVPIPARDHHIQLLARQELGRAVVANVHTDRDRIALDRCAG